MRLVGIGTIVVAGVLAVVALLGFGRYLLARRARLRGRETTIAGARPGERVAIAGTAELGSDGPATSPATGRSTIAYRTRVLDPRGDTTDIVHVARAARSFWIADPDGARIRVDPDDATEVIAAITTYGNRAHAPALDGNGEVRGRELAPASMRAWVREVGGDAHEAVEVEECCIAPGERVVGFGVVERDPDGGLRLRAGAAGLVVSGFAPDELARMLGPRIRTNLLGLGLLAILAGVGVGMVLLAG